MRRRGTLLTVFRMRRVADANEIRECYHDTFETEADHELEDWERCFKTEE